MTLNKYSQNKYPRTEFSSAQYPTNKTFLVNFFNYYQKHLPETQTNKQVILYKIIKSEKKFKPHHLKK